MRRDEEGGPKDDRVLEQPLRPAGESVPNQLCRTTRGGGGGGGGGVCCQQDTHGGGQTDRGGMSFKRMHTAPYAGAGPGLAGVGLLRQRV